MPSRLVSKIIAIGSWIIFLASWLTLLVRAISHWGALTTDVHWDLIWILTFFGVLWFSLVRKKDGDYELLAASMTLASVVDIVRRVTGH